MKLDLPALGRPSSPTSASTRNSSASLRLSPGSPRVNCRGARPVAAAAPAVAAVGAAIADVFLATKRGRAVAAFAGVHLDLRLVDEFHGLETKKPYRLR